MQRVALSPKRRWKRQRLLLLAFCCGRGAVEVAADDVGVAVVELLALKRGRLRDLELRFLLPPFLTKLTLLSSSSSKAAVKDGCCEDEEGMLLLTMLLIDVADFSSGRP